MYRPAPFFKQFTQIVSGLLALGLSLPLAAQSVVYNLESDSPQTNGFLGSSVAAIPDTNNDAISDIAVGAREDVGSTPTAGVVYVYSGSTGLLLHTLTSPTPVSAGGFGADVAGLADATGDSFGDIIVGAPLDTSGASPNAAGRAYIFDGATGALHLTLTSPNEETSGNFGASVATVGDITGDARSDVIVGATNESPESSPNGSGRAYVFNGSTGALIYTFASPNEAENSRFGASVAGVPSVTGTADMEFAIGAYGEDKVYLFESDTGTLDNTFATSYPLSNSSFGGSVAGVEDINGDGKGEVLVGARQEDPDVYTDSGRAYLFDGFTGSIIHAYDPPTPRDFGYYGTSVSSMIDITGDGYPEVIVGSEEGPAATGGFAGRVYVYNGVTGDLLTTIFSPNEVSGGLFGLDVAGIEDLSSDGESDIVISGFGENYSGNPSGSGTAYVFGSIPIPVELSQFGLE